MGFLDDVFSKKKETVRVRTAKAVPLKKDPEKKLTVAATSRDTSLQPQSNSSIFGSLKRGQTGVATSTPKKPPAASKAVSGKSAVQLRNKPPDKDKKSWFRTASTNVLKKEPIKSSTTSLDVIGDQKSVNVSDVKTKSGFDLTQNVTLRRGQNQKIDGQSLPDNLSRTSSTTNLDVEQKGNKGAKPRKTPSKDRIDKIGDNKKHEKKGVTKNNNQLESGDSPFPSIDSLQEEEFVQLRRQLQEMAQEKSNLALQLGEQKGQLNLLQKEIQNLKEESNIQLEHLTEENTALRNRLRDVAHSPLSDNEKQQLLYETHRHHSSAPASIATNLLDDGNAGDITACPTPDWDKHSSSNVSEVSVACLQDKINQMQETHYSTNEELQATLQELTDLQRQLTELQQENERLNEEKTLMFDSLCRQTERLNDSRSEVESLKQLLYREKDETGQYESAVEREQKLVDLLKSAQEERETLLVKLEQISNEVQEARAGIIEKDERIVHLSERVRTLESTLDAKHAEHKLMDQELAQAKDQCSGKQIEINRLTDLLDNARTKISELEQDRALSDKSELDELLDNARKEKDALESEVAHLKEQLAISKNETDKLREQVSILQEECKVTRNNAKTTQSDLEYKCEKLLLEKNALNDQLQEFQEAVNELQVQSQCQLEDKRQLSAVLSETQRNLSEAERRNLNLESELQELKKLKDEENEEWEKFQNDLLTSVRVANDFKTEAQQELQRMIMENKSYRERERQLKAEIDKLKGEKTKKGELSSTNSSTKSKISDKENIPKDEMDSFLKLTRRSKEKPRRTREKTETVVSEPKLDKSKEKKADRFKFVKKRERPSAAASKRHKTLSVEEELLMKSLNDWYEKIDLNVPEANLTEEQKVVKKLKTLYEDESLKEKPMAHKPKDQLAISKPLLDSVFLNPKLEGIVKDPSVPTIEEMRNSEIINYENQVPELRNSPGKSRRQAHVKSENFTPEEARRISIIGRSKSFDDVYTFDEKKESPILYRCTETDDLRQEGPVKRVEIVSSITPSDSVSNPRYTDFSIVVNLEVKHEDIQNVRSDELKNSSVNFETLDKVLATVPRNVPEHKLSHEQQFALRLKKALDEAERKNTLKKLRKKAKQTVISSPTMESVQRNSRLRHILLDPDIQSVTRRNSDVDSKELSLFEKNARLSKSYQDITFTFNLEPRASAAYVDSNESILERDSRSRSIESFTSAEFNVETGSTGPYSSTTVLSSQEVQYASLYIPDESETGKEELDSLEYNETLRKHKANKVSEHVREYLEAPRRSEEFESETPNFFGRAGDREFDSLYKETLDTNLASPSTSYGKLRTFQTVDDLVYNETLNKNVSLRQKEHSVEKPDEFNKIDDVVLEKKLVDKPRFISKRNEDTEIIDVEDDTTDNREFVVPKNVKEETAATGDNSDAEQRISKALESVRNLEEHLDALQMMVNKNEDNSKIVHEEVKTFQRARILEEHSVLLPGGTVSVEEQMFGKVRDHVDEEDNRVNPKDQIFDLTSTILLNKEVELPENKEFSTDDSQEPVALISGEFLDVNDPIDSASVSKNYEDVSKITAANEYKDEYDYHAILKENKYGVVSPLNIRLSYKDVVKEIKHKFPTGEEENVIKKYEGDSDDEGDAFFDNFFGVKRNGKENEPTGVKNTDIDKEMEEIFEKYLHTPLSKVLTAVEDDDEFEVKEEKDLREPQLAEVSEGVTELSEMQRRKFVSVPEEIVSDLEEEIVWQEVKLDDLSTKEETKNDHSIEEIMLIIDDSQQDPNEVGNTSTIDAEKERSKSEACVSDQKLEDKILSRDLDKELVLAEKIGDEKHMPDIIESVNKNIGYNTVETDDGKMEKMKADFETHLTEDELNLVRKVQSVRFSRPLSDFNDKDLQMIEKLSLHYIPEGRGLDEREKDEEGVQALEDDQIANKLEEAVEELAECIKDVNLTNVEPPKATQEIEDVSRTDTDKEVKATVEQTTIVETIEPQPFVTHKINPPADVKKQKPEASRRAKQEQEDDLDTVLARMLQPRRVGRNRNSKPDESAGFKTSENIDELKIVGNKVEIVEDKSNVLIPSNEVLEKDEESSINNESSKEDVASKKVVLPLDLIRKDPHHQKEELSVAKSNPEEKNTEKKRDFNKPSITPRKIDRKIPESVEVLIEQKLEEKPEESARIIELVEVKAEVRGAPLVLRDFKTDKTPSIQELNSELQTEEKQDFDKVELNEDKSVATSEEIDPEEKVTESRSKPMITLRKIDKQRPESVEGVTEQESEEKQLEVTSSPRIIEVQMIPLIVDDFTTVRKPENGASIKELNSEPQTEEKQDFDNVELTEDKSVVKSEEIDPVERNTESKSKPTIILRKIDKQKPESVEDVTDQKLDEKQQELTSSPRVIELTEVKEDVQIAPLMVDDFKTDKTPETGASIKELNSKPQTEEKQDFDNVEFTGAKSVSKCEEIDPEERNTESKSKPTIILRKIDKQKPESVEDVTDQKLDEKQQELTSSPRVIELTEVKEDVQIAPLMVDDFKTDKTPEGGAPIQELNSEPQTEANQDFDLQQEPMVSPRIIELVEVKAEVRGAPLVLDDFKTDKTSVDGAPIQELNFEPQIEEKQDFDNVELTEDKSVAQSEEIDPEEKHTETKIKPAIILLKIDKQRPESVEDVTEQELEGKQQELTKSPRIIELAEVKEEVQMTPLMVDDFNTDKKPEDGISIQELNPEPRIEETQDFEEVVITDDKSVADGGELTAPDYNPPDLIEKQATSEEVARTESEETTQQNTNLNKHVAENAGRVEATKLDIIQESTSDITNDKLIGAIEPTDKLQQTELITEASEDTADSKFEKKSNGDNVRKITPEVASEEIKKPSDDLDKVIARIRAPRNDVPPTSKLPIYAAKEKSDAKVLMRKPNYEGVKSKLEYFSRNADESPSKRQSHDPFASKPPPDRRRVKSWAEQFEKRSLDTHSAYEPVYAKIKVEPSSRNLSPKMEKKPLPVPRVKNQSGQSSVESSDRDSVAENDSDLKDTIMSEGKILSENDKDNVHQEIPNSDFGAEKVGLLDVPVYYEMPTLVLEKTQKLEDGEKGTTEELRSKQDISDEMYKRIEDKPHDNKNDKEVKENIASVAESSFSSIAVAGKSEQLDLTKVPDDIEEVPSSIESNLNLFHLETSSLDESYLNLFKLPEDKMYENISGYKRPPRGYFNFAYLGETSDSESFEEFGRQHMEYTNILDANDSKPRIIDFVPMDSATKPVFKKDDLPNYDTLEREKTFHVLNSASSTTTATKISQRKSTTDIDDYRDSSGSFLPSGSRTSFSAAKKMFEALAEANMDKNGKDKDKSKKTK